MLSLPMASVLPTNFYWMKLAFWESRERISAIKPEAITATMRSPWIAFASNS